MARYTISRSEDVDTVREVHSLAFPYDKWPGDDHEYWLATDEAGKIVGFASAIYWSELQCVFLSRAGIISEATGQGLQRRLVKARVRWARTISGCKFVWTYCERWNYASLFNLMKCGFKVKTYHAWGPAWHIMQLPIDGRARIFPSKVLKKANPKRKLLR